MLLEGDRSGIEDLLKRQLDTARVDYEAAHQRFRLLMKDIPGTIPHPDGNLQIRQAGETTRAALQNYKLALKRFTDYTLSGAAPKDLAPPE